MANREPEPILSTISPEQIAAVQRILDTAIKDKVPAITVDAVAGGVSVFVTLGRKEFQVVARRIVLAPKKP